MCARCANGRLDTEGGEKSYSIAEWSRRWQVIPFGACKAGFAVGLGACDVAIIKVISVVRPKI